MEYGPKYNNSNNNNKLLNPNNLNNRIGSLITNSLSILNNLFNLDNSSNIPLIKILKIINPNPNILLNQILITNLNILYKAETTITMETYINPIFLKMSLKDKLNSSSKESSKDLSAGEPEDS